MFTQAVTSWSGEAAIFKSVERRSFLEQQDTIVKVLSFEQTHAKSRWTIRADLLHSLTDECIHESTRRFSTMPEQTAWLFESAGAAPALSTDAADSCLPQCIREAPIQVAAIHQWDDSASDALCRDAAWRWMVEVVGLQSAGGPYPSFLEKDEPTWRLQNLFGGNWNRLLDLKRKLDRELPVRRSEHTNANLVFSATDVFRSTYFGTLASRSSPIDANSSIVNTDRLLREGNAAGC